MITWMENKQTKGHLVIIPTDIKEVISYQPGFKRFFINEKLGIPAGTFIEWRYDNSSIDGQEFLHIIIDADSSSIGRSVSQHKISKDQIEDRKNKNAFITITIDDSVNEYLNLPPAKEIKLLYGHPNCAHFFDACMSTFHNKHKNQWEVKTRRGITIDLKSVRTS
jgi:hypothetical protein